MAPSVQSAIARYLVERSQRGEFRPQTLTTVRGVLHHFSESVGPQTPVEKLTKRQVRDWWASLALSPNTCRNHLSMVRTWNRWCVEREWCRRDLTIGIKAPRSPRTLPVTLGREEIQKLMRACPDERTRIILLLMLQAGLRAGEVCGLQTGDVDLVTGLMRIHGKGGHERIEPIPTELAIALTAWCRQLSGPGPMIRRHGDPSWEPLTRQYLSLIVARVMTAAGVKVRPGDMISAHALRRTAISDVLEQGAPLSAVQAFAGHANIASLRPYIRLRAGEELRSAVEGRSYLEPG